MRYNTVLQEIIIGDFVNLIESIFGDFVNDANPPKINFVN